MRRAGLAVVLAAGLAHANGRPPLTNGVKLAPNDPHSLYVATTFGLLVSHDDGCTFRWACEANVGYGGIFDPKYGIATDGTIFASTFTGLRVSRDGGCSFTTATAELPTNDPNRIADLWIDALDIGPTGEIWVGTAESGKPNDVFVSADNGSTFSSRGVLSSTIWWKSVRVAPSNAMRVYIAGYEVGGATPVAHLLRSDDDGEHWTRSPLTGVTFGSTPIVLAVAVDPTNQDIVFVTSVGANGAGDLVYRSTDGGMTFAQVLAAGGNVRDFVIVDAHTVLVATWVTSGQAIAGGPAYRSSDGGHTFRPMAGAPQLACLAPRSDGTLIGCGANWDPDHMAIARSTDGGATWQKVWRFVELAGPITCADGTVEHDVCAVQQWPALQQQFATTGPTCGAVVVDGAADGAPGPKHHGGCCDSGANPIGAGWVIVVGIVVLRRRRR
jgi:hypothetical protein